MSEFKAILSTFISTPFISNCRENHTTNNTKKYPNIATPLTQVIFDIFLKLASDLSLCKRITHLKNTASTGTIKPRKSQKFSS